MILKFSARKDICYCNFGYNGSACENFDYLKSERCTYQCSGHGQCAFDHYEGFYAIFTCHCLPGYYGYGCELFDCSFNCNYNGICVDNDTCSCYDGFKGKYCEVDCGCGGNGVCAADGASCICDAGFVFNNGTCQKENKTSCVSGCTFGDCVLGVCVCWAGLTGPNCVTRIKAPNHGAQIGINPNGVVDWSTQWAFVDLIKQARAFIVQHIDKLNNLYIWSLGIIN